VLSACAALPADEREEIRLAIAARAAVQLETIEVPPAVVVRLVRAGAS
jgi:hypothetical protein